jgi:ABC-type uncharacterized transport system permease subunit
MQNFVIGGIAATLYAVTGGLLGLRLSRGSTQWAWPKGALLTVALAAVALHSLLLYQQIFIPGGMNLGFVNALSLVGWLAALLLVMAAVVQPVENIGVIVLPLCAATIVFALFFPSNTIIATTDRGLEVHIVLSIMANALLGMSAVQALLLAVQDRHLHDRRPGGFIRALPPLITMEHLLFQLLGSGFALLTLALVTGFLFLEDIFAQHLVHKTVLSIAAWFVFATLLWGRWRYGWRGRAAIIWTLGGFAALLLAYFGSKLVLEIILPR